MSFPVSRWCYRSFPFSLVFLFLFALCQSFRAKVDSRADEHAGTRPAGPDALRSIRHTNRTFVHHTTRHDTRTDHHSLLATPCAPLLTRTSIWRALLLYSVLLSLCHVSSQTSH